ncbi:MAG: Type III pantothenate kinase [Chloroflexi bacterium ADurb.Bin180]|nr:MAG: Type III pantothenate kinase [Chloroflexi bacterium ADurb.Bin180]
MLLCVNVGNSNVVIGLADGHDWLAHWRVRTIRNQMPDEYAMLLKSLLRDGGHDLSAVDRIVLASVVPPLTTVFSEVLANHVNARVLMVSPDIRTGLQIRIDNPRELGADLLANAVAAYQRYRGACIVVDFGTATTFSAVSAKGDFEGVAIAVGLGVAAEALTSATSQLPRVSLSAPAHAIGKNTVQSMQSGLVLGHIGLVEGVLRRMKSELGGEAQVIATGGHSRVLAPLSPEINDLDPWLTLDGLRLLHLLNPV